MFEKIVNLRVEIPEFTRCCMCVPLRRGILILGYLNVVFSALFLTLEIWLSMDYQKDDSFDEVFRSSSSYTSYHGVGFISHLWLITIIYIVDIIFNVILLVGAHMKHPKLMQAYYYFGITTCLATFVCFLAVGIDPFQWGTLGTYVIDFCFAFCGLGLQVYLLFLIRSELKKLYNKTEYRHCFVNHACEVYVDRSYNGNGRNPL